MSEMKPPLKKLEEHSLLPHPDYVTEGCSQTFAQLLAKSRKLAERTDGLICALGMLAKVAAGEQEAPIAELPISVNGDIQRIPIDLAVLIGDGSDAAAAVLAQLEKAVGRSFLQEMRAQANVTDEIIHAIERFNVEQDW